jgi:ERCC4-related helicase
MILRGYQKALLEMSKKGNVITFLGTGSGKTLIAMEALVHHFDTIPTGKVRNFVADLLKKRPSFLHQQIR